MPAPTPDLMVYLGTVAHKEFVRVLLEDYDKAIRLSKDPVEAARQVLQLNIPALAGLIGDAALAALLWGASGVGRRMPRVEVYGTPRQAQWRTTPWDGAAAWMPVVNAAYKAMMGRRPLLDWIFDAARVEVRQRAFTVSGIASQRALEKVQKTLGNAIMTGASFPTWHNEAKKALATGPVGIARAETIYRTNLSQSFHRGQEMIAQDKIVGDQFPYVFVYTIPDTRRSEACRTMSFSGLNGTACYRRDDKAYIRNRTIRHPNCRCADKFMTIRQAAALGVTEAKEWLKRGSPPVFPAHVPYFEVELPTWLKAERDAEVRNVA